MSSLSRVAAVLTALALPSATFAAPFLNVDFNRTDGTTASPTQAGFAAFDVVQSPPATDPSTTFPVTSPAVASNAVTVKLTGGVTVNAAGDLVGTTTVTSRDRAAPADSGAFTHGTLYRDFAFASVTNGIGVPLGIELTGLNPSTKYQVTLYVDDATAARTDQYTDLTGGGAGVVLGAIAYSKDTAVTAATPDGVYSLTATVTSDAKGRLLFQSAGTEANDNNKAGLIGAIQLDVAAAATTAPAPTTAPAAGDR